MSTTPVASTGASPSPERAVRDYKQHRKAIEAQIAAAKKDTRTDCKAKEARVKALQAQLQRVDAQSPSASAAAPPAPRPAAPPAEEPPPGPAPREPPSRDVGRLVDVRA